MKKALLVPLLVVLLAVGFTAFHAHFLSNDRVDWYLCLFYSFRRVLFMNKSLGVSSTWWTPGCVWSSA
jgi:hypothetical protein